MRELITVENFITVIVLYIICTYIWSYVIGLYLYIKKIKAYGNKFYMRSIIGFIALLFTINKNIIILDTEDGNRLYDKYISIMIHRYIIEDKVLKISKSIALGVYSNIIMESCPGEENKICIVDPISAFILNIFGYHLVKILPIINKKVQKKIMFKVKDSKES